MHLALSRKYYFLLNLLGTLWALGLHQRLNYAGEEDIKSSPSEPPVWWMLDSNVTVAFPYIFFSHKQVFLTCRDSVSGLTKQVAVSEAEREPTPLPERLLLPDAGSRVDMLKLICAFFYSIKQLLLQKDMDFCPGSARGRRWTHRLRQ